jgi:circadian clock protein KaiC
VLTGSARVAQGSLEKASVLISQQEAARRKREVERKRAAIERQIGGLRSDYEAEAWNCGASTNSLAAAR